MGRYQALVTVFDLFDKQKVESLKDVEIDEDKLSEGEADRINEFISEAIERYEDEAGYEE